MLSCLLHAVLVPGERSVAVSFPTFGVTLSDRQ